MAHFAWEKGSRPLSRFRMLPQAAPDMPDNAQLAAAAGVAVLLETPIGSSSSSMSDSLRSHFPAASQRRDYQPFFLPPFFFLVLRRSVALLDELTFPLGCKANEVASAKQTA
jgi:hypothetical protein